MDNKKRLVIGISGASGAILGIEVLKAMKACAGWETHLVVSKHAERTIRLETEHSLAGVCSLADRSYDCGDISACISSGTFETEGMAIVPCSMKTAACIACGYSDNLLLRAADVALKERKTLVIVPRECPLSEIHIKNLFMLSKLGAVIMPPVMSFYMHPQGIGDMVSHIAGKVLSAFGIVHDLKRWGG